MIIGLIVSLLAAGGAAGAAIEEALEGVVNNIVVEIGFNNFYYSEILFNPFVISESSGGAVFAYTLSFVGGFLRDIEDLTFIDLVGENFISYSIRAEAHYYSYMSSSSSRITA